MTDLNYAWNPFQDIEANDIKKEAVTTQGGNRVIFIPRKAPFFSKKVKIVNTVTNNELVFGRDYVFCYPFDSFVRAKSRLCYGGIVLLGNTTALQLEIDYSTIGNPFVLDDVSYLAAAGNILVKPRLADWRDITNLPLDGFPPDPHDHPMSQTLDYADLITVQRSLINAMNNETNNPTVQTQLVQHSGKTLAQAHGGGTPADVGLDKIKNYPLCTIDDLQGNSDQLLMTLGVTKELFKMMVKQYFEENNS